MSFGEPISRDAVLKAIEEFDRLGQEAFLRKYAFGPARSYFLIHEGRHYPSKAIVGAAHGYQYPTKGPLSAAEFSGGEATVKQKLKSLGFTVTSPDDDKDDRTPSQRNPRWTRDELILALDLYIRGGRKVLSEKHSDVVALSELLNLLPIHKGRGIKFRNPNGVAMKLANFRRLDPDAGGGRGLARGSSLEPRIWDEFAGDQKLLRETAEAIAKHARLNDQNVIDEGVDLEEEFAEGRILLRAHRMRERSGKVVMQRKKAAGERPKCEVCGFDFFAAYGELGRGFIECHHVKPVSQLEPGQTTKVSDLALVCANCHRMLHRQRPWLSIDQLRQRLRRQGLSSGQSQA